MKIQPIYVYQGLEAYFHSEVAFTTWIYARVNRQALGHTGFNYTVAIL